MFHTVSECEKSPFSWAMLAQGLLWGGGWCVSQLCSYLKAWLGLSHSLPAFGWGPWLLTFCPSLGSCECLQDQVADSPSELRSPRSLSIFYDLAWGCLQIHLLSLFVHLTGQFIPWLFLFFLNFCFSFCAEFSFIENLFCLTSWLRILRILRIAICPLFVPASGSFWIGVEWFSFLGGCIPLSWFCICWVLPGCILDVVSASSGASGWCHFSEAAPLSA